MSRKSRSIVGFATFLKSVAQSETLTRGIGADAFSDIETMVKE